MENQKIINLLNNIINETEKFVTRKLYINDQNFNNYGNGAENGTTIKFETKVIKLNLCDYSDAYTLVTGDIENKADGSSVAFKNCACFENALRIIMMNI